MCDCLESTRGLMQAGVAWDDLLEVQVRGDNEGAVRWYTEGLLNPLGLTPDNYRDIGRAYARSIYGRGRVPPPRPQRQPPERALGASPGLPERTQGLTQEARKRVCPRTRSMRTGFHLVKRGQTLVAAS